MAYDIATLKSIIDTALSTVAVDDALTGNTSYLEQGASLLEKYLDKSGATDTEKAQQYSVYVTSVFTEAVRQTVSAAIQAGSDTALKDAQAATEAAQADKYEAEATKLIPAEYCLFRI